MHLDGLRTSLIVDPSNGMLPPLLPAAQARVAARPKRSYDDPEGFGLAERCLLGNFGLGGSIASPPMLPSEVVPSYYQIVQTDAYVTISRSGSTMRGSCASMAGTHRRRSASGWAIQSAATKAPRWLSTPRISEAISAISIPAYGCTSSSVSRASIRRR